MMEQPKDATSKAEQGGQGAPQQAWQPVEDDYENVSIVQEFFWFLKENKKWWLMPLVALIALFGLFVFLSQNPVTAPFIYSLM